MMLLTARLAACMGLISGWVLFAEDAAAAAGGVDTGKWGNLTALGAVITALLFIIIYRDPLVYSKFVEQSKVFADSIQAIITKQAEVIDKNDARAQERERIAHDDREKHAEVLRNLAANCSARAAQFAGEKRV